MRMEIFITFRTKQRQSWSPLVSTNSAAVLERSEAYQRVAAIAKRTGRFPFFSRINVYVNICRKSKTW